MNLDLSSNPYINVSTPLSLNGLKSLKSFTMALAYIQSIEDFNFSDAIQLEELNLGWNNIDSVGGSKLKQLNNLKSLSLHYNSID